MVKEVMTLTLNECSDLEPTVNGASWYPKNGTLKVLIKFIYNFAFNFVILTLKTFISKVFF